MSETLKLPRLEVKAVGVGPLADLVSLRQTIEEAEKRGWADLSDLSDEELDDLEAGGEGDDEDDE